MELPSLWKPSMPNFVAALTLSVGPHSVCGVCFDLNLNKSTSYLSLSLTEFFLGWDIKNMHFTGSWNQVLWVLAGLKSQPCGFKSQSEVKGLKRIPISIDGGYVSDHTQLKQKSSENCFSSFYLFTFFLKDNCFTEFCFLSNINMNKPQVYIYLFPLEPPSHFPSPLHPTRLLHRLTSLRHTASSHWLPVLHIVM